MGYCRNCGTKLEDDMAYCPKCGTPVAVQERYQRVRHEDKAIYSLAIAGGATLAAVAIIIVALIAVGLLPAVQMPFGQVGSGHLQTQQVALSDFTTLDVSSGFNIQITQASTYSINITTDDNLQQYVDVYKTGNTLTVKMKPALGYTTTVLKAEISMPDLQEVQFSGGVIGNAADFNMTHNFNVELSGGSSLTMTGQAVDLTALCSGGATLHLSDFKVNNANVNLSGGSQATINLDGTLDANLSGGASISKAT